MFDTHTGYNIKTLTNTILKTMIVNMLILSLGYADVKNNKELQYYKEISKISQEDIKKEIEEYKRQYQENVIDKIEKKVSIFGKKAKTNSRYNKIVENLKNSLEKEKKELLEYSKTFENLGIQGQEEILTLFNELEKTKNNGVTEKNTAIKFVNLFYGDFSKEKAMKLSGNLLRYGIPNKQIGEVSENELARLDQEEARLDQEEARLDQEEARLDQEEARLGQSIAKHSEELNNAKKNYKKYKQIHDMIKGFKSKK